MMPKKILSRLGKIFYWSSGDLHTTFGMLKEEDLKKETGIITSNVGKEFVMMHASFLDQMQKISRGPQSILEKDIAVMIGYTMPDPKGKIVEVGSGSGKLTCFLARLFPDAEIISYDRVQDHVNLAQKNVIEFGFQNVTFKVQDVLEAFDEKDVDAVYMDIPDPERAIQNVAPAIKNGGSLVVYVPTIAQVMRFVDVAKEHQILVVKVSEVMEREWHVDGLKVRPVSSGTLHTAFLVFCRKI